MTGSELSVRRAKAAILAAAVLVLASAAACGGAGEPEPTPQETSPPFPPASPLTLADGGQGDVAIRVTWVTPDLLAFPEMERAGSLDLSRYLAFYVRLDTDSVDLSRYDLGRMSVLHDLGGGEYQPEAWLPWTFGSYHREGLLLFRSLELGGEGVELVIRGVGGVSERSYRWVELPGG